MYQLMLLVITLAFILPLVGAMYYAALALVDSFKRDTTPFLAPVYATYYRPAGLDWPHAAIPFGIWQVACLASTSHHPAGVRDTNDADTARV